MPSITYPSRDLSLLDPQLKTLCDLFVAKCATAGITIVITQTHRSGEYQNQLFAQGRTQGALDRLGIKAKARPDLPEVTKASAGKSPHEFTREGKPWSRAFDVVIKSPNGTLNWDADTPAWKEAGAIGLALGLDWGGAWWSFKDASHFQLSNWRTRA